MRVGTIAFLAVLLTGTAAQAGEWEFLLCGTKGWAEAVRDGGAKTAEKYVELERCSWAPSGVVNPMTTIDGITVVSDRNANLWYAVDDMQRKAEK